MKVASTLTALAMVAVVTAACGSTVPTARLPPPQAGSSGLAAEPPSRALPESTVAVSPAGGTSSSGAPMAGVPVGDSGPSTSVAAGSGGGQPAPSVSVTDGGRASGPIKIGALTATGAQKFQQSLGFSGATGDQVAMTQSVVNFINAHGGLGGRKIQLVSYDLDPTAVAANQASAMQAACTYFTQDNKVTAVASYVALAPDNFYQCLANAHVPLVTPDEGVSSAFFQRYPNTVYMPSAPSYTRLLADSVDALWDAGWLTPSSIVGVVGYDTSDVHAIVAQALVPALQRHGLKLTTGMYTATTTSAAGEYGQGVLSFKSQRVDRVFFAPGGEPVYFALAAELQAYHPRYELGSLEYPNVLTANLGADQLAGSMGLGWLPYLDLPSSAWASVSTPGISACRTAMASAKQDFSSGTTLGIAAWICDDWMFFRDVFAAGASPDQAGIRRAAESLGDSFQPAATFRTSFGVGRTHDGAAGYRLVAFQPGCKCFTYTSPVRTLP